MSAVARPQTEDCLGRPIAAYSVGAPCSRCGDGFNACDETYKLCSKYVRPEATANYRIVGYNRFTDRNKQ